VGAAVREDNIMNSSAREKVVVIGSNSFSGSDFIDLLLAESRYEVHGLSRSPEKSPLYLPYKRHPGGGFTFHQMDLNRDIKRIGDLLDSLRPEYVVNFAAQSEVGPSWEHPGQWFETNAVGVTNLVHLLNQGTYLRRYVHISSPEVYGTCHGVVREDAPLNPSTPYAASKAAGDLSLFTYYMNYGFPFVMIRSTNVYGPHQQLFKIIPRSSINVRLGRTIELHGGGRAVKSYIHIRDISRGERAAMEDGRKGEIYHLSPDEGISVRDLVKKICRAAGVEFAKAARDVEERLGQDAAYVINSDKARSELGWKPRISLDEGLKDVKDWVDREWEAIKREPLEYIHKP